MSLPYFLLTKFYLPSYSCFVFFARYFDCRKSFSRCNLAVGSLKALIQSLTHVADSTTLAFDTDNAVSAAHIIRSYLRRCFSENMVLTFVKLGYELEQKLIRPRLYVCQNSPSISSDIFEPWEHLLWVCHIQLSLTIGRGFIPCLDNHESRLQIFRAVVDVENQLARRVRASDNSIDIIKRVDPEDQDLWPLNCE